VPSMWIVTSQRSVPSSSSRSMSSIVPGVSSSAISRASMSETWASSSSRWSSASSSLSSSVCSMVEPSALMSYSHSVPSARTVTSHWPRSSKSRLWAVPPFSSSAALRGVDGGSGAARGLAGLVGGDGLAGVGRLRRGGLGLLRCGLAAAACGQGEGGGRDDGEGQGAECACVRHVSDCTDAG
jgi:hypothetical protein